MIYLFNRRLALWTSTAVLALLGLLVVLYAVRRPRTNGVPGRNGITAAPTAQDGEEDDEERHQLTTIKAVHPKRNKAELVQSVTQPAYVQAYYRAELMTRVAGLVKAVNKNIGEPVKKGEVLIELDV